MENNNLDVKKIREKLGLTQQELADKLLVTLKTVQNWEYGKNIPKGKREILQQLILGNNYGIIGNGNKNNTFDNRQYYSDSPDVLRHQIDMLEERIKEKDAQIKDQAKQIFELIKKIKC